MKSKKELKSKAREIAHSIMKKKGVHEDVMATGRYESCKDQLDEAGELKYRKMIKSGRASPESLAFEKLKLNTKRALRGGANRDEVKATDTARAKAQSRIERGEPIWLQTHLVRPNERRGEAINKFRSNALKRAFAARRAKGLSDPELNVESYEKAKISEEIVNPDNRGTMTKAEIIKRDRIARSRKVKAKIRAIKGKDTDENARYRYATFITMMMRGGKKGAAQPGEKRRTKKAKKAKAAPKKKEKTAAQKLKDQKKLISTLDRGRKKARAAAKKITKSRKSKGRA